MLLKVFVYVWTLLAFNNKLRIATFKCHFKNTAGLFIHKFIYLLTRSYIYEMFTNIYYVPKDYSN